MMTRELSQQALLRTRVEMCGGSANRAAMYRLLAKVQTLKEGERQLVLAEAATLVCMHSLQPMNPLYESFEDSLWELFSKMDNLTSQMESFLSIAERLSYAQSRYYDYLRGMFERSGQARHQFYYEMLADAEIEIEFNSIDFGENAAAFEKKAEGSVHVEHLIVFYSVELFLKAYISLHPRDSPLADEKLESIYRHFEAAIPLIDRFVTYAKDDGAFKFSASRKMLPPIN